jgi:hypothetical protein
MRSVLRVGKRVLLGILGLLVVAVALLYGWSTWRLNRHYEVAVERIAIPIDAASIEGGRYDFVQALRTGVAPRRRALDPAMPRAYGQMTDDELHAIWSYLRTVAAKGRRARQKAGPAPPTPADRVTTAS